MPGATKVMEMTDHVIRVMQGNVRLRRVPAEVPSARQCQTSANASANIEGTVNLIDPPCSDNTSDVRMITDGTEVIIVVTWKKPLIVGPMPVRNMWCAHTRNDIDPMNSEAYSASVAPQGLARADFDHVSDDAKCRQHQHVDLGVREKPEQVLPRGSDFRLR